MQNQRYQINISVGEALYRQLRAQAAREDRTVAAVARRALGAHYGVEARPAEEIPLHPDASGNTPAESRVEYDRAPEVDLGEPLGSYGPEGGADHGEAPSESYQRADPARLARARAALGGHAKSPVAKPGRKPMTFTPKRQADEGGAVQESRVEYDHEALRASKRSGNDSGRGL